MVKRNELWGTDTETTGTDMRHGCKPFFVSSCSESGKLKLWEWDVDPMTRQPHIPAKELREVRSHMTKRHVMFNAKFDVRALQTIKAIKQPRWEDIEDAQLALHALTSSESMALKEASMMYLGIPDDDQKALQNVVNHARRIGRKLGWRIGDSYDPTMPAVKSPKRTGWWVVDMWVPRAVALYYDYDPDHDFWHVCTQYAQTDAERTVALWDVLRDALQEEGLEDQYNARKALLPVTYDMEERGITYRVSSMTGTTRSFKREAAIREDRCYDLANGWLRSIKSTDQLRDTLFTYFGFDPKRDTDLSPKLYLTDNGQLSTNKDVLQALEVVAEPDSDGYAFIKSLQEQRKYTKALEYIDGYRRGGSRVPVPGKDGKVFTDFRRLHPNFKIPGTKTTRQASYDPNAQNITKQELINLRRLFQPLPHREWWSIDYQNVEMRIFAYESGDKNLIRAFDEGFSVHLIFAEVLWPKEYRQCVRDGVAFNDRYKSTLYQWVKNGNFSLIYGAGRAKANSTYRHPDAYDTIRRKLPLIDKFMSSKQQEGRRTGYVSLPGGYRLQVPTAEPHKAVNYFVQGTAGWLMGLAMVEVYNYLKTMRDYFMIMAIHDELDFDFPLSKNPRKNVKIITKVGDLMAGCGEAIGVPTPVDIERHQESWAKGVGLQAYEQSL